MAIFKYGDRIQETSTTTTDTIFWGLSGAVAGYKAFSTVATTGQYVSYAIVSASGTEWEVGYGYLSGTTYIIRTGVYSNSNGDTNLVNFSAGTKNVFLTDFAKGALTTAKMSGAGSLLTTDASNGGNVVDVPIGTAGYALLSTGSGLTWGTPSSAAVFTISASSDAITPNVPVSITVSGQVEKVKTYGSQQQFTWNSISGISFGGSNAYAATSFGGSSGEYPFVVYQYYGNPYCCVGNLPGSSYEFSSSYNFNLGAIGSVYYPNLLGAAYDTAIGQLFVAQAQNYSSNTLCYAQTTVSQSMGGLGWYDTGLDVKGQSNSNIAVVYDGTNDCMLVAHIDGSSNLRLKKFYKSSGTYSYASQVTVGTAGAYTSMNGYTFTGAWDGTNGGVVFVLMDLISGATTTFCARGNGSGNTAPTASAVVSAGMVTYYNLNSASAMYFQPYGGILFAYTDNSVGNVNKYMKINYSSSSTPTLGTPVTINSPASMNCGPSVQNGDYGWGILSYDNGSGSCRAYLITATTSTVTFGGYTSIPMTAGYNPMLLTYGPKGYYYNFSIFNFTAPASYLDFRPAYTNIAGFIGLANSSGGAGATTPVSTAYMAAANGSGYTTGAKYYVSSTGTVSTSSSGTLIGKAANATTIVVTNSPGLSL